MKTGCDIQIFGVVRPQKPVPQGEIEDDEVDVELEVRGRADALEYRGGRHQLEMDNLAVTVLARKIPRRLEIENEEHIVADPQPRLHTVGDDANRDRLLDQRWRDRGLLL